MKISASATVQDIFNQFNDTFPYLRLEFYNHAHGANVGSDKKDQVSHQMLLKQLNPTLTEVEININPEMSVADFEKMMLDKFMLNVQVFRKSADIWLQTSATDHWSLEKQNGKGQRSGEDHHIEPIDIRDFDLE
ncbi:MAG: hypothetical protein IPN86_08560 [Saprospiraceae bacterium]|nr:hypothetical protein [Saprospiraceae bacterium]